MSRYYIQYRHGQITIGVDGTKSVYCAHHDKLFNLGLQGEPSSHKCFWSEGDYPINFDGLPVGSAKILPKEDNIDYKFTVRRDGVMDFMDADRLLSEWYNWWAKSEHTPAKMPDSIHTRTAVYLATRNMVPKDDGKQD